MRARTRDFAALWALLGFLSFWTVVAVAIWRAW